MARAAALLTGLCACTGAAPLLARYEACVARAQDSRVGSKSGSCLRLVSLSLSPPRPALAPSSPARPGRCAQRRRAAACARPLYLARWKIIDACAAASRPTIALRAESRETASPRLQRASPGSASGPCEKRNGWKVSRWARATLWHGRWIRGSCVRSAPAPGSTRSPSSRRRCTRGAGRGSRARC